MPRPVVPAHYDPPRPEAGTVVIDAPHFRFSVRLGDGFTAPTVDPGWEIVARPDDTGITEWSGGEPRTEEVPILLDGFAEGRSVEREIAKIESLTEVPHGQLHPPVFVVRGGIHLHGRRVVLESLGFGDYIRPHDRRLRQALTLGLREFERPDQLKIRKRTSRGWPIYTTVQGDTLKRVAAKQLKGNAETAEHVSEYARTLSILNNIRDVNRRLDPGTKLKLPP